MKKKTNILYIVNSLIVGGTQKVLIDNANNLNFNKYDVHVASLSPYDKDKTISSIIEINPKIKFHYFDCSFFDTYSILGYLSLFFKNKKSYHDIDRIVDLIHGIKPEIIHFHTSPRELIMKKFFKFDSQYVFTDHTLRINKNEYGLLKSRLLALLFRKLYSGYRVIAVSDEIKNSLINNKIVNSRLSIITILNGVNINEYYTKNHLLERNKFAAIYVSRIDNNKGHIDLIKAWSLLKDIDHKCLYIVGPDGLNSEVQNIAIELGCQDSVVFTGSVSNPKEFISKANIGIFPSYKEGLPLALLEKMAMELPVIVSDIKELASIITDGEDGLTYKLGNVIDLSEKIRLLYTNAILAQLIGKNARKTVERKYNSINNTVKLEQFYDKILN